VGIVAGYGLAVLGLTYYMRERIGAARWRRLHRLTAVFWLAASATRSAPAATTPSGGS
jgi:DMSO/TMAO reductase YedYZ heme-binding membrane subunit